MAVIQEVTGDSSHGLAQNIVPDRITANNTSSEFCSLLEYLSITCMTIIQQEIPVLRNSIDRLQCSGTNTISIVSIAGSNGYIGSPLFPCNTCCCKAIPQVVTILIAELSFVCFVCQRAIYIVGVDGCTISTGYLRKQLIVRIIFVIYCFSNAIDRLDFLCTVTVDIICIACCERICTRPGFIRQTVKIVIGIIDLRSTLRSNFHHCRTTTGRQ